MLLPETLYCYQENKSHGDGSEAEGRVALMQPYRGGGVHCAAACWCGRRERGNGTTKFEFLVFNLRSKRSDWNVLISGNSSDAVCTTNTCVRISAQRTISQTYNGDDCNAEL